MSDMDSPIEEVVYELEPSRAPKPSKWEFQSKIFKFLFKFNQLHIVTFPQSKIF